MDAERVPMDLAANEQQIRTGRCFVCGVVRGDPDYHHEGTVAFAVTVLGAQTRMWRP